MFSQHELDNFRDLEMRVTHLSPGDQQQGRIILPVVISGVYSGSLI